MRKSRPLDGVINHVESLTAWERCQIRLGWNLTQELIKSNVG